MLSCPVPFLQSFSSRSCSTRARPWKRTAENGKDRRYQARTGRSSLSEYSNSTSFSVATSFFHVFTPFSLCFWPVYNGSRVFQNTFEGLSNLVQGSVEDVQGLFCTFPIKIHLLMANLRPNWSNTTERFLYSTVFAAVSGNASVAANFQRTHALRYCATHGARTEDEKGGWCWG